MRLVIDIPDKYYNELVNDFDSRFLLYSEKFIVNGTPLPKGHGRLGDLDFVAKRIKAKPPIGEIGKVTLEECYQEILQADTIIEADGGNANGKSKKEI